MAPEAEGKLHHQKEFDEVRDWSLTTHDQTKQSSLTWVHWPGLDGFMAPEAVSGAAGEVARVLSCSTHYQVLEVEPGADDATLKRAKKLKQLATHPDKLGPQAAGAGPAFQRVVEVRPTHLKPTHMTPAWDTFGLVSNVVTKFCKADPG